LLDRGLGATCKVRIPEPRGVSGIVLCNHLFAEHQPSTSSRQTSSYRVLHKPDNRLPSDDNSLEKWWIESNAFVITERPRYARTDYHLNEAATTGRHTPQKLSPTTTFNRSIFAIVLSVALNTLSGFDTCLRFEAFCSASGPRRPTISCETATRTRYCEAMIDGSSLLTLAHHQHPTSHDTNSLRHATLRRKSAHLWDITQGAISGYPSPPMSSPPSPTRRPSDLTLPSTRGEQFSSTLTNPPLTSSTPAHSLQQTTSPSASFALVKPDVPAYHPPASFATGLGSAGFGSGVSPYVSTQYAPPPVAHHRTPSHDARKAKTHVASACVNCKRAHLSCDVQRPCARCTASGKQVSLFFNNTVKSLS
jgi:hypothetical protein